MVIEITKTVMNNDHGDISVIVCSLRQELSYWIVRLMVVDCAAAEAPARRGRNGNRRGSLWSHLIGRATAAAAVSVANAPTRTIANSPDSAAARGGAVRRSTAIRQTLIAPPALTHGKSCAFTAAVLLLAVAITIAVCTVCPPASCTVDGLKVMVTPCGAPLAARLIEPLKVAFRLQRQPNRAGIAAIKRLRCAAACQRKRRRQSGYRDGYATAVCRLVLKLASPAYVAVMLWEPTARSLVS